MVVGVRTFRHQWWWSGGGGRGALFPVGGSEGEWGGRRVHLGSSGEGCLWCCAFSANCTVCCFSITAILST